MFAIAAPASGDECGCNEQRRFYYIHPSQEMAPYMELYYWQVDDVQMATPEQEQFNCTVTITFVIEGSHAADILEIKPDDEEQIFFNGQWWPFEKFEAEGIKTRCFEQPVTS
jgi:hypothetical protein